MASEASKLEVCDSRAKENVVSLVTLQFIIFVGPAMCQILEASGAILAARMGMSRSPHLGSEPLAKKLRNRHLRGSVSYN